MRRLEFRCDGCDLEEHVVLSLSDKVEFFLEGWVAHHLITHENGVTTFENSADLCPDCAEKMRHAINPANWPRMDPTLRKFAKKGGS